MSNTFQLRRDGELLGSYTGLQLRQMARDGELNPSDTISDPRTGKTRVAKSVNGLFSTAAGVTPSVARQQPPPFPNIAETTPQTSGNFEASGSPGPDEVEGSQLPLSTGSTAMRALGGLCMVIGVADFVLYNTGLFDIYAGIPAISANPAISFFTAMLAMFIGSMLLRVGAANGTPRGLDYAFGVAGGIVPLTVAFSLISMNGVNSLASVHDGIIRSEDECIDRYNMVNDALNPLVSSINMWAEAINDPNTSISDAIAACRSCSSVAARCRTQVSLDSLQEGFAAVEESMNALAAALDENRQDLVQFVDACNEAQIELVKRCFNERSAAFSTFAAKLPLDASLPSDYGAAVIELESVLLACVQACSNQDIETLNRFVERDWVTAMLGVNSAARANGVSLDR